MKTAVILVLLGGSFCVFAGAIMGIKCSDWMAKRPLNLGDVERLDVLLLHDGKPYIVSGGSELDRFLKEHPDSSFLVPEGRVSELNQEFAAHGNPAYPGVPTQWRFKVKPLPDGSQSFEVQVNGKNHNITSWYEVRGSQIIPKYEKICGIGQAISAVPYTIGLWLFVWTTISEIRGRLRRRANSNGSYTSN